MAKERLRTVILLFCSTVALIVLLYHVLNSLRSQYALVHFSLFFREGAKNDFVIFLRELILDDILRPASSSVHPQNGATGNPKLAFAKNIGVAACLSRLLQCHWL
jgi:hypothetical protein